MILVLLRDGEEIYEMYYFGSTFTQDMSSDIIKREKSEL